MNPSSKPSKPPKLASPAPASTSPSSPSSPSSVSSARPSKIPFPQLKQRVNLAINACNDEYAATTAIIVYWEDDDTGAEADAQILETTFKNLLGIEPVMWKILNSTLSPSLTLKSKIINMLLQDHSTVHPIQTLFIFAYIGHGSIITVQNKSELEFTTKTPGRRIPWSQIQSDMGQPHTSALAILDCCHSGLKGAPGLSAPAIQTFAACAGTETARARGTPRATFTRRLCGELEQVEKYGESFINTEEMFQRLRINTALSSPNPRLLQNGGVQPILLKLKKPPPRSSSPSRIPRPKPPKLDAQHVIVKLTLTGPEAENVGEFGNLMMRLPEPFHVRLIDVFKTDRSSLVIMRMRWQTWARLSTVLELHPIGVATGESLLRGTASASSPEVRRVGENLPLRPGPSRGKD